MLFNPDPFAKSLIGSLMKLHRINFEVACNSDKIKIYKL